MFIVFSIAVLLLISAFFSLSETGITGASRSKIYKLKVEGDRKADKVINLLEKKDRLITTILLVNNALNIGASSLVTVFFINKFGDRPEIIFYATALMTIIILIFSEVLPKVYALKAPEEVALNSSPIISLCVKLFYPITWVVEIIVNFFLRFFRLEKDGMEGIVHGLDALRGALELYHEEGDVVKEDKDMLGSILDLDEVEISEIMRHRKDMEAIDIETDPAEVIKFAMKSQYSRIPVYANTQENIIGILHTKSLMKALADGAGCDVTTGASLLDIRSLLMEAWFVPESTTLKEQLVAFREKKQHFALVVDEYGSLMGMITLEDIIEEIVGNIDDEYDTDSNIVEETNDGSIIIDGTMPIRDLNREMNWNLPLDVGNTIAGLIINNAEMIPAKGQAFNFYGFRFEVLKKKRNQVVKVKISRVE